MTVSQVTDFTRNQRKVKFMVPAFIWMFLEVNLFSHAGPIDCVQSLNKESSSFCRKYRS